MTNNKRNRCECGKAMNKFATRCKACTKKRFDELHAKAAAIVATGVCPDCGAPLRRNFSITGWFQCSQFGADGFRADSTKAACGFQTFTE